MKRACKNFAPKKMINSEQHVTNLTNIIDT